MTVRTSACRSCGRSIIWTVGPNGKRIPLDARPATMYEIREDAQTVAVIKRNEQPTYISHFLTCPDADKWGKRT